MSLIEQFFKIIAPSSCMSCGNEGRLLCLWCTETALPDEDPRCYRCNRLTKAFATCAACKRKSVINRVWIRTRHTDYARQLVHSIKFKYSHEAAGIIASELMNTLPALPPNTLIVHVPTITSHVRSRGFDHAKEISVQLSKLSGLRHATALSRLGQHRQVGSKRSLRVSGIKGTFRTKNSFLIKGSNILLVDDVLTTGATIEEAARVLRTAGAKSISALIFARAK